MADGLVAPPSNDAGLSAGSSNGGTGGNKSKRNLIIAGGAVVGLLGIYLFAKSRSSSSSNTATTPTLIAPASNTDTTVGGLASSLQEQLVNNNASFTNGLSAAFTKLEADIAGNQSSLLTAIGNTKSVAVATPAPAPITATAAPLTPLAPGVNIIGRIVAAFNAVGGPGTIYISSGGGVYNAGGSRYYGGSNQPQYNQGGTPGQDIVGGNPLPGGGYEEINAQGQTYNFGPGPGQTNSG